MSFNNSNPGTGAVAITPNNSAAVNARVLYIGTTGDITIRTGKDADTVTFANHPVGYLPCRAYQVLAAGTTASDIVAIF